MVARTRNRRSSINTDLNEDRLEKDMEDKGDSSGTESDSETEPENPAGVRVAVKTPHSQQKKRRAVDAVQDLDEENPLMAAVRSDSIAAQMTATDWVDRYKSDRADATAEVLTFLLQACGISGRQIDAEEVEHSSADDIKQEIDALAQEKGLVDIFSGRSAAARLARLNYKELWDKLLRASGNAGDLQDGFLLERVINLAIAMSTSAVRDFRRVATMTAAQISCTVLAIAAQLIAARNQADAQARAEESRGGRNNKAALERSSAYQRQVDAATKQIKDIMDEVDSIFQSVFTSRFRDVDAEIRLTVVEAIGRWMQLVPSTFMTSTYLKYIAWALSDRDANVRKASLVSLRILYDVPENTNQLRDFSERFQDRFRELVDDVNDSVAVEGVKLLTQLIKLGHLEPTVSGQVFALMSCSSAELRAASAELIAGMLEQYGKDALDRTQPLVEHTNRNNSRRKNKRSTKKSRSKRGKANYDDAGDGEGDNESALKGSHTTDELELAGMLYVLRILSAQEEAAAALALEARDESSSDVVSSELAEQRRDPADAMPEKDTPPLKEASIAKVVISLMDRINALQNWQLMVHWMKNEVAADVFGPAASVDLAACMLASLRDLADTSHLRLRGNQTTRRKALAAKDNMRQSATMVLVKEMQGLIRKYQTESNVVASIISLLKYAKLEVYSLRREEKSLSSVLDSVKSVLFAHSDPYVCRSCIEALSICARHGPDTARDAARSVLNEAVDAASKGLKDAVHTLQGLPDSVVQEGCRAFRDSMGEDEAAEFFTLRAALTRAVVLMEIEPEALSERSEVRWAAEEVLYLSSAPTRGTTWPILFSAGRLSLLLLMWDLRTLAMEEDVSPNRDMDSDVKGDVVRYASQLEKCVNFAESQGDSFMRHMISLLQTDLMTLFSSASLPEKLRDIAFTPSEASIEAYWKCMEEAILSSADATTGSHAKLIQVIGEDLPTPAESMARICASLSVPRYDILASRFLSYWGSDVVPEHFHDVAKDLVRVLKLKSKEELPKIFLQALQHSFLRCEKDAETFEFGEEETGYDPISPFLSLAEKIVLSQTAFTSGSSAVISYVTVEGTLWVLQEPHGSRAEFLQGICYFAMRLKGASAGRALTVIQRAAEEAGVEIKPSVNADESDPWLVLYLFVEKLKEQAAKASKPRSSLKKAVNNMTFDDENDDHNVSPGRSQGIEKPQMSGRRISFAPGLSTAPDVTDAQTIDRATSLSHRKHGISIQRRTSRFAQEAADHRSTGNDPISDDEEGDVSMANAFDDQLPLEGELPSAVFSEDA